MAAVASLLAVLAGLLRGFAQLAVNPSVLTALAATILAGAVLAAVLVLLTSVAGVSRAAAVPMLRRARALREKSWRAGFTRQRDPDAAGRSRPRAPAAAPAAASGVLTR
jgi:acetylglutamate kinase